jgi:hypothetical protein
MRSIGKKYKNLVIKLTRKVLDTKEAALPENMGGINYFSDVENLVYDKLPEKIFDTWEGAAEEINSIIDYEIENYRPSNKKVRSLKHRRVK